MKPRSLALIVVAALCAFTLDARAQEFGDLPPEPETFSLPAETPAPPVAPPPAPAPSVRAEEKPSPPPAPAAPEKPAAAQTVSNAEEGFTARTAALEENANNLNQMVQGTKYRLLALAEQILGSGATSSGAKLSVWHRNELGSSYVITSIVYVLDGQPIYTKVDESGALGARDEFVLFDSRVVPGPHQLAVQYEIRGHGFGLFSYLEELRLTLKKSLSFNVEPGKVTRITGAAFEKGSITVEFKDRPDINFEQTVTKEALKPLTDTSEGSSDAGVKQAGADK